MARKVRTKVKSVTSNLRSKRVEAEQNPEKYANKAAILPKCRSDAVAEEKDKDQAIWIRPSTDFFENPGHRKQIHEFVLDIVSLTGITVDRVLYNLRNCNFDIEETRRVIKRMPNKKADPWSEDDLRHFHDAIFFFGKDFSKISEAMPHKTLQELVSHYYKTKYEENYTELQLALGPDGIDRGCDDSEDEVTMPKKGKCHWCARTAESLACDSLNTFFEKKLLCTKCIAFRDLLRPSEKEPDHFPQPHTLRRRYCVTGLEDNVGRIALGNVHSPISVESFQKLKAKELEKVKANIRRTLNCSTENGRDFLNLMATKNEKYGFYFLNFDYPPSTCQLMARLSEERSVRGRAMCLKLEKRFDNDFKKIYAELKEVETIRAANFTTARALRGKLSNKWTAEELNMAKCALMKYGTDFQSVAAVVRTKSTELIEELYKEQKERLDIRIQQAQARLKADKDTVNEEFENSLKINL